MPIWTSKDDFERAEPPAIVPEDRKGERSDEINKFLDKSEIRQKLFIYLRICEIKIADWRGNVRNRLQSQVQIQWHRCGAEENSTRKVSELQKYYSQSQALAMHQTGSCGGLR